MSTVFITDTPADFPDVPRVETSDIALGGNEVNVPNRQFNTLARRDRWLRNNVDALRSALGANVSNPIPNSIRLFGGNGEQGSYTLNSGSDTFGEGIYYFNNFTVGAGATLNISQFARIFVLGNCTINGTITISPIAAGGASFGTDSIYNVGGLSGAGIGGGSGSSATGGRIYSYSAQSYGSGGASGFFSAAAGANGTISGGGEGGGGLIIECAGTITIASGATISAIGGNAIAGVVGGGTVNISGGGGGSGGTVILASLSSISVAGTVNVRGGNGANAVAGSARGGAGGGGGQVALIAPTVSTVGATILLNGGTTGSNIGGAGVGGGNGGGNGGTGGGGGAAGTAGAIGRLTIRNFRAVG